jgi:hypothetical protein
MASIAIKPAINSNEIIAAIRFALGLSFHDLRPWLVAVISSPQPDLAGIGNDLKSILLEAIFQTRRIQNLCPSVKRRIGDANARLRSDSAIHFRSMQKARFSFRP